MLYVCILLDIILLNFRVARGAKASPTYPMRRQPRDFLLVSLRNDTVGPNFVNPISGTLVEQTVTVGRQQCSGSRRSPPAGIGQSIFGCSIADQDSLVASSDRPKAGTRVRLVWSKSVSQLMLLIGARFTASSGSIRRSAALPKLWHRGVQDHRRHPGAAGDREDPCAPGAGSAASTQWSGARIGTALRCLSRLRCRIPIATGCGYSAAGVAVGAASACHEQHKGRP